MPRPSRNTDKLLLQAGRELLTKTGSTGLNLREVAARAKVNLGMFHYHFKTKDEFVRQVLQGVYEDFFESFSVESGDGSEPLEALRRGLNALGRFSRDKRELLVAMIRDVLNGDEVVVQFVRDNVRRHTGVLLKHLKKCQDEGSLRREPELIALTFLIGGIAAPNFIAEIISRAGVGKPWARALQPIVKLMTSDEAIAKRVEFALRGLRK